MGPREQAGPWQQQEMIWNFESTLWKPWKQQEGWLGFWEYILSDAREPHILMFSAAASGGFEMTLMCLFLCVRVWDDFGTSPNNFGFVKKQCSYLCWLVGFWMWILKICFDVLRTQQADPFTLSSSSRLLGR